MKRFRLAVVLTVILVVGVMGGASAAFADAPTAAPPPNEADKCLHHFEHHSGHSGAHGPFPADAGGCIAPA